MDTLKNMNESIKENWEQFPSSLKTFMRIYIMGFVCIVVNLWD